MFRQFSINKDYVGTSLSHLTKATGLTKGAIYCNFTNKENLAVKAFEQNVKLAILPLFKVNNSRLVTATNYFFRYRSIYPIFSSSTSTFDDLSSTGNLKDIKNIQLRNEIIKHYAQHKQVAKWIKIGSEWALPNDAPFTYNNSVMRFEPVSTFLFGEQNLSEQAYHLRDKKEEYINNAAVHFWINKDAIANLERLITETTKIINLIEKELKK